VVADGPGLAPSGITDDHNDPVHRAAHEEDLRAGEYIETLER
jgi:hypothetical protein